MNVNTVSRALLGAVLATASVPTWAAAPVITTAASTGAFVVSNVDLLQTSLTGAPLVSGLFSGYGTGGESVLRDGNPGSAGNNTDYPGSAIVVTDASVTYTFDLATSAQGYHITAIHTFGAWDEGRDRQDLSIAFATVAAPTAFVALADYSFDPDAGTFSRVTVTPGGGATYLAQNVFAIRFTFPTQENSAGAYRELDVLGVSAVPEPATWALWLAGAGLLAGCRRRVA